jgi:hypothetical protein
MLQKLSKRKRADVVGTIRDVDFCGEDQELFGWCELKKNKFVISLSRKRNTTLEEYAGTLLHELIHLWVGILQRRKYIPESIKDEHKMIAIVEGVTQFALHQIYVQRPKTMPKRKKK